MPSKGERTIEAKARRRIPNPIYFRVGKFKTVARDYRIDAIQSVSEQGVSSSTWKLSVSVVTTPENTGALGSIWHQVGKKFQVQVKYGRQIRKANYATLVFARHTPTFSEFEFHKVIKYESVRPV